LPQRHKVTMIYDLRLFFFDFWFEVRTQCSVFLLDKLDKLLTIEFPVLDCVSASATVPGSPGKPP
jgi:hypothetical protein